MRRVVRIEEMAFCDEDDGSVTKTGALRQLHRSAGSEIHLTTVHIGLVGTRT